jgi:NAD(P)H-hydrate epimerase
MRVLTAEQMQAADAHAIDVLKIPSIVLMENAAIRFSRILLENHSKPRIASIVCGKGNNGGDGMAVARLLKQHGWTPTVILLDSAADLKKDPAENWKRAVQSGVRCLEKVPISDLSALLAESDLVVDALFGTGLTRALEGMYAAVVDAINSSGKEVWSIDVPSGLNSDTGEIIGKAVHAKTTVALAALKYCHIFSPACELCGRIYVVDIGIPTSSKTNLIQSAEVAQLYPQRKADSHKGTFGHVVVVGGSRGKSGAPYMSGKAALRSGAGLVTVFSPSSVQTAIAALGPEVMTQAASGNPDFFDGNASADAMSLLSEKSVAAIGPGIGTEDSTGEFLRRVLEQADMPIVIDADALNLLASHREMLSQRKARMTVLTPHPGEMARLLKTDIKTIQKDRRNASSRLAEETKSIVVLKGYRTLIADPDGSIRINPTGGQALSSAGTGDILTGAIAGLIAQGLTPLHAAIAGVYTHGFTGNLFEYNYPQQALNAMDILDLWNKAVHLIRSDKSVESEYLQLHFAF